MLAWWLSVALAQEPADLSDCLADLEAPTPRLSVAWITPVARRARRGTSLEVIPTAELVTWIRDQEPSVGRFLQAAGLRKRGTDPRGLYRVTLFDADSADLCRPIDTDEPMESVAGLPSCAPGLGRMNDRRDGCGHALDRASGKPGFTLVRVEWQDAARQGFCVLPAQRFVEEAAASTVAPPEEPE